MNATRHNSPNLMDHLRRFVDSLPHEATAIIFRVFAVAGEMVMRIPGLRWLLSQAGRFLGLLAIFLMPAVPYDLRRSISMKRHLRALVAIFFLTMFFCLLMNAYFACKAGTLAGLEHPVRQVFHLLFRCGIDQYAGDKVDYRLFYVHDYHNLILYFMICPLYVTTCAAIIITTLRYWRDLKLAADKARNLPVHDREFISQQTRKNAIVFGIFAFVLILATSLLISIFLNETIDPQFTPDTLYWFVNEYAGQYRVLNSAGAYYLLMNAMLLAVTWTAAFCFFSMSAQILRIGYRIQDSDLASVRPNGNVPHVYNEFCFTYICAKVLIILYALNLIIWNKSPAGTVSNTYIAVLVLAAVALLVVPTPRLYLEYKWQKNSGFRRHGYRDLRSHHQHLASIVLNIFFLTFVGIAVEQKFHYPALTALFSIFEHMWH